MKLIDVSRPVFSEMTVWPGDESVLLERTSSIAQGSMANVSRVHMGVHTGTHIDAPLHYIDVGKSVDKLNTSLFTGNVLVVDIGQEKIIQPELVEKLPIGNGEAVFFKTAFSGKTLSEAFDTEYTGLSLEAAQFLIGKGVQVIGTDALSIENFYAKDFSVHRALLGNEILIVEGLNLRPVSPGKYQYICMPIFLQGADGAPARVMLIDNS